MKRDINDVVRDATKLTIDNDGNKVWAIDLRKIEENSWIGQNGRHDVTEGPCLCGAWHKKGETRHLPRQL